MRSTIEIYRHGQWIPAAEFSPLNSAPFRATFEYRLDYVFSDDPVPLSLALPVSTERLGLDEEGEAPLCPAFLLDLVPQGEGNMRLLRHLQLPRDVPKELILAQHGAFSPIGNLRIDTAVDFYERTRHTTVGNVQPEGVELKEVLARRHDFLGALWLQAGITGVQGAAPKFQLTQNHEGRWFPDAALPDEQAAKHWLVKLPRGKHETDLAVLRNEAAYLHMAARCGLRTAGEPMFIDDMLFVPRFDRQVGPQGVERLHQESLSSLAGIRGFGINPSLFELVEAFYPHVTNPAEEVAEFIKRDILNVVMRNTDNHARNTAVQRLPDGRVQLTPLFDFAPMYLDQEMIVRSCKWQRAGERELSDWNVILGAMKISEGDKRQVARELRDFADPLGHLDDAMKECGVDEHIIELCVPAIDLACQRLADVAIQI